MKIAKFCHSCFSIGSNRYAGDNSFKKLATVILPVQLGEFEWMIDYLISQFQFPESSNEIEPTVIERKV